MASYSVVINSYFDSFKGLSSSCWRGIILSFIESILSGICFFLTLYFVEILKINIATAGIIMSFYGLGTAMGGIIGGKLSDIILPVKVSIISLLTQSCAFFALLKFDSAYLLMINLFIIGLATYGFITSNHLSVLKGCRENEKLQAINLLSVSSNLGASLSAIIVGMLSSAHFRYYFFAASVFFALLSMYLLLIDRNEAAKKANDYMPVSDEFSDTLLKRRNKKGALVIVLSCIFFIGLIVAQLGITYPIYLQESFPDLGIKGVSFLFAINSLLIVFLQTYVVKLFDKQNKFIMVGIGGFLIGISMLWLNFSFIFAFAVLACVVFTAGEMVFFSMAQLICYESGEANKKGRYLGLYRMIYAFSFVVGPFVGGHIYHNYGRNTLWYISGIIGILCLSLCVRYKNILLIDVDANTPS